MKLLILSSLMACQMLPFASRALCQEKQPDRPYLVHEELPRLYFSIPSTNGRGRVELTAARAQRNFNAPLGLSSTNIDSILQLRGGVAVVLCSPGGHGCDHGAMHLHADAVDYNEKTGALDAHGDVHIDPFRSQAR
jgi:hypothetical protein